MMEAATQKLNVSDANNADAAVDFDHLQVVEYIPPFASANAVATSPMYIVPPSYRQQPTMGSAWAAWYGSEKDVCAIAEKLMKLKIQALSSAYQSLKKGRHPSGVLLYLLGISNHRADIQAALPDEFHKIDMRSRLEANLLVLIGQAERDRLKRLCQASPAHEVMEAVLGEWPIMRSLYEAGAFSRTTALTLLFLSALQTKIDAGQGRMPQVERFRIEMAFMVLAEDLPTGLKKMVRDLAAFMVISRGIAEPPLDGLIGEAKLDPNVPLHLQMSDSTFVDLLQQAETTAFTGTRKAAEGHSRLLAHAEAQAIAMQPGRNALTVAYSKFVEDYARPEWQRLIVALNSHAKAMEAPLDQRAFTTDLVGRDIEMPRAVSLEAIELIRTLINSTHALLDPTAFIQRADKKLEKVRDLQLQISTLGQNLTAGAMLKIASVAEGARTEILSNQGWFRAEVEGFVPLVKAWQRFYMDWERITRKGTVSTTPKLPAALALVEKLSMPAPTPTPATLPGMADLQEHLETALADNAHKERELNEARTELFSLRQKCKSMPGLEPVADVPVFDADLMRRIALRETMTPVDVLAFFHFVAADRVLILDSAWKSAREAALYPYPARMLTVLDTMIYAYFDLLREGNPDAVARDVLGNSYSAKESETVGSAVKLRAQREFLYDGQTRYFERHLKIGNGGGLEGMRVYFDILDGKVVIAYVGPHLDGSIAF